MEFARKNAIYLQIADYLCGNILSRTWKEGDRIPSVRELAASMEVNPNTVMRTYTVLQEKGIIMNQRGIGFFVAEGGLDKTLAMKKDSFVKEEAPAFFRTMELLGMGLTELEQLYNANTHSDGATQGQENA